MKHFRRTGIALATAVATACTALAPVAHAEENEETTVTSTSGTAEASDNTGTREESGQGTAGTKKQEDSNLGTAEKKTEDEAGEEAAGHSTGDETEKTDRPADWSLDDEKSLLENAQDFAKWADTSSGSVTLFEMSPQLKETCKKRDDDPDFTLEEPIQIGTEEISADRLDYACNLGRAPYWFYQTETFTLVLGAINAVLGVLVAIAGAVGLVLRVNPGLVDQLRGMRF